MCVGKCSLPFAALGYTKRHGYVARSNNFSLNKVFKLDNTITNVN